MRESFTGIISDGRVLVEDVVEAGKIHSKGQTGKFTDGGRLFLTFVEAFYLMNEGKLRVENLSVDEFLKMAVNETEDFEVRYIVYHDLRKRGFIVADGEHMKAVRGGEKDGFAVIPVYERVPFSFDDIYMKAGNMGSIFAVVDGDGDLTYYHVKAEEPEGPLEEFSGEGISIVLLEEMGFAKDFGELHREGFYGKIIGKNLHLSAIECAYLVKRGIAEVRDVGGRKRSAGSIVKKMKRRDPEFGQKMRIYGDLRDRGLIVKTGFKYGTHFRVYVRDIEHHAPYLVHAVPENYTGTWPEISRGVRLAHGVKKDFLLAEASKKPRYLKIKRVRL